MPINSSYDKEYMFQQTFLGASIQSWNTSMGFNSNSTTVNINLVEDAQNKRIPNAVDEGYHIWDIDKGFPEGASLNYQSGGDALYAPSVGEPVYFTYYKSIIKTCGECLEISGSRNSNGTLKFIRHTNDEATCSAAGYSWTLPPTADKQQGEKDGWLEKVFEFNGILKSYKRNSSSSGITYEIALEDPRMMLEGSNVILNSYAGTTPPPDKSFNMIDNFNDGKEDNVRTLNNGYMGYYNIINAYGYYEYFDFGGAEVNRNGFEWRKILTACQTILQGKYDIHGGADLERMGGPLYYVQDSRDQQLIKATSPVDVHRYKVDLSPLDNLSDANGGLLPDIYRIKGDKMSLLSLVQNICETAGADFFVELLRTDAKDASDPDREYSGIIKITPMPRTADIEYGKIQKEIDTAVSQHGCGAAATHQWANRIVSHSMGYEFKDPVSGVMMLGGKRTRVVGVSDIGWFSDIGAGLIRERFFSGNEKLKEFLPEIEHDGVTFANPGWHHPHNFPYTRGYSYDQAGTTLIPPIMPASPAPASNDDYLAWGKALVPNMHAVVGGVDSLAGAVTGSAPWMPQGTYGDGLLDIFPCWGFLKGVDRFQGPFANINLLQQKAEGIPVMGGFADDNPYNDFDTGEGIFTIFEYYDPYSVFKTRQRVGGGTTSVPIIGGGQNNLTADGSSYLVCYNPYHSMCYVKGRVGAAYRYKLLNQQFDSRANIFVSGQCCGANGELSQQCIDMPSLTTPTIASPGKYCKNPNSLKGKLVSWDWYIPPVNVIPVNLAGTGWKSGPVNNNGNYSHYHYTTVTALRAALDGYESWLEYTIIFEPWLHCNLGVSTCPMIAGLGDHSQLANAFDLSGGYATWKGPMEDRQNPGECIKKKKNPLECKEFVQKKRGVLVHSFNRWLGIDFTGCANDANAGEDGRIQEITEDVETQAKTWLAGATVEKTLSEVFNRVSKVAKEFYGKKYLVPLPFTPPEVGQHLRQVSDEGFQFEESWTPTSNGWVDIDVRTPELGKRYPHNINFYDGTGKLGAFAVYPQYFTQIISKRKDQVTFPGAGSPSNLDPQNFHVTTLAPANSMGGDSLGKVFAKATADEQVYWLWNPTTYQIQTGRATTGTLKPYALITVNTPATYGGLLTADVRRAGAAGAGGIGFNTAGLFNAPPNSFWKFKFQQLTAFVTSRIPLATSGLGYPGSILLGKVEDGRNMFYADFIHPRAGFSTFGVGDSEGEGSGRFTLHPAMFKPWTAAVPMISNRYRWGPWAEGRGFGKAELIIDNSFAPESFGGYDNMEVAAISRLQAAVEPNNPQNGWAIESGTINLAGLPSKDDVDNPRVMGLQLMGTGPYVTDVNVSIGTEGITTTYSMKTQRKAHKLNEIYENRIRQSAEDFITLSQDLSNFFVSQSEL